MGYKSAVTYILAISMLGLIFSTRSLAQTEMSVTEKLVEACYADWRSQGWTVRGQNRLAAENAAFRQGIRKVCQARAELYMEGYEIRPFIKDDSQRNVYPLIFSSDVEAIKSHLKAFIKPLQLL